MKGGFRMTVKECIVWWLVGASSGCNIKLTSTMFYG